MKKVLRILVMAGCAFTAGQTIAGVTPKHCSECTIICSDKGCHEKPGSCKPVDC